MVPGDDLLYYGGYISIGSGVGSEISSYENVSIILEPAGPMIDGSAGETLHIKYGSDRWNHNTNGIVDIPIGRYRAIAIYNYEGEDYLLYLQNRETGDGFKEMITFDFLPQSRFMFKNAVVLEFREWP